MNINERVGKVLGMAIVAILSTAIIYGLISLVSWDANPSHWLEITRALWVGGTVVLFHLWTGGSARSAVERLW